MNIKLTILIIISITYSSTEIVTECSKCHYGKCLRGTCYCLEGFYGKYCDRSLDPHFLVCLKDPNDPNCHYKPKPHFNPEDTSYCPYNCSEQGVCINGKCECEEGFEGTFCEKKVCLQNCNGNGKCRPDKTCECFEGYSGKWCEDISCDKECADYGGHCNKGVCFCPEDRYGNNCEFKTCPDMCSGNGYCRNGECECLPDYTSANCAERQCFKNCNGHGHCNSNFECVCYDGFKGKYCDILDCACSHGICKYNSDKNKIYCDCVKGYSGDRCDQRLCKDNCNGQGICTDGSCKCNDGYYGIACELHKCPFDCWHRGSCEHQKCTCFDGYRGEFCEKSVCQENCNNNGNCVDRKCQCFASFYGDACEYVNCPVSCSIHGECVIKSKNEFVCSCKKGWSGDDCSTHGG